MSGGGERPLEGWWRWAGAPVEPGAGPAPEGEVAPRAGLSLGRRDALKLMAAASALSTAGCLPPEQETVPYVDMPEGLVPGRPRHYATALPLLGPAAPAVVESHEGRPTKVEGNGRHPERAFGSDAFAQASLLGLYDPERSRACYRDREIQPWDVFDAELAARRERWQGDGGRGLRLLTGSVTSPTLGAQIADLLRQFPEASWHSWDAVPDDNRLLGARRAFGRPLDVRPRFERARVVLSLDADPLGPGAQQVPLAADFAEARRARAGSGRFLRLYAVEPVYSLTGAAADHRLPLPHARLAAFAAALAVRLGGPPAAAALDGAERRFLDAVAADLQDAGEAALVLAGDAQPPELHALVHWINGRLGALGRSVEMVEPLDEAPPLKRQSLAALVADMAAGAVDTLVVLGGNPVYDAPADLGFERALGAVPFSLRFGCWHDETSAACRWHLAAHHLFEGWSDARARDGTVSLVQPLIRPLFDTRSGHQLVAALAGDFQASDHALVRRHWHRARQRAAQDGATEAQDFESWWRRCLHDGWIPGTAAEPVAVEAPAEAPAVAGEGAPDGEALALLFRPDASVWDGRFAENAWLQELPRPFSKLTWGNALHLAPAEAERRGLADGDLVDLVAGDESVTLPVLRQPGQAEATALVHLGYGRTRAGPVGSGVGVDVYPLRAAGALWARADARLVARAGAGRLATTQHHHSMEGRDIVRETPFEALAAKDLRQHPEEPPTSLYPEWPRPEVPHVPAWSMVVDQTACIGCNACVAACQAENNVPVVGPEEIERGRTMHWLRIDSYHKGPQEAPETLFQPVPCMHCEKAPCEPVCPVEASVHDAEGLNAQVYNRCVGTRFCQSNCPYQVRRFNFYGYAREQEYAHLGEPLFDGLHNPDVTVRARGVMEKCTYCVQRIKAAEHDAIVEDRPPGSVEVVTACQQACPTRAIHFGNLAAPDSEVAALRRQPHEYGLLEHLGTRPRTRYLARVRRRNPALDDSGSGSGTPGGGEGA